MMMDCEKYRNEYGNQDNDHPCAILKLGHRKDDHHDKCADRTKSIDQQFKFPLSVVNPLSTLVQPGSRPFLDARISTNALPFLPERV